MMQTESKQQVWSARVQEQAASGVGIRVWCVRGADRGDTSLLAQAPLGAGARIFSPRKQLLN
jgi:hypothetical protein